MPITEALKKLIKTITGKNAVGETIEELVQNLNDNYPEGGGGGTDNDLVVSGTLDLATMGISGLDKTFAEISAAAAAKKNVRLNAQTEGQADKIVFAAQMVLCIDDVNIAMFLGITDLGAGNVIAIVIMSVSEETGNIVASIEYYPLLENNYSPLIVPGTIDAVAGTVVSTQSVPLVDIYNAFAAGIPVYFEADTGAGRGRFPVTSVELNAGVYTVVYAAPMILADRSCVAEIKFVGNAVNGTFTTALAPITPYVCDVSASGFDITVNDTPESLNAAWAENREIFIIVANIRLKMTECNYTDATNYRFKFYAVNPSTSTGILETFSLIFDKTMTATLDSKNYTPAT